MRCHLPEDRPREEHLSLGDRVADRVTGIGGSWRFIFASIGVMGSWIAVNLIWKSFDPYPFILLNLALSTLAALQAPAILMSNNRAAARDREYARQTRNEIHQVHLELHELRKILDGTECVRKTERVQG